jgi:two-component system C4-dicarboxylate transport response regulator DctD
MDQVEKVLIEQALKAQHGNLSAACEALGIARKTLYDKLARHGIVADEYR